MVGAACRLALRDEVPQESIMLVVDAGGEIERARHRVQRSGGEAEPPQPGDGERLAGPVQQTTLEMTGAIVGIDVPVPAVADQECAAECSQHRRRQGQSPGGVEAAFANKPLEQVSVRAEDVDESVAG